MLIFASVNEGISWNKRIKVMKKAVIYARVSSTNDRQSTDRQVIDLKAYASCNDMEVVKVYEEHISGAKKNDQFFTNAWITASLTK